MKKSLILILGILLGILVGSLVSELLGYIAPRGVVRDLLVYSVSFGIKPVTLNLGFFTFTIGFSLNFTAVSLLILVTWVYYFKWWLG